MKFKIDQNEVAKLWATKRNNPKVLSEFNINLKYEFKMNAAKFLRALRDKYKCKMIEKGDSMQIIIKSLKWYI